MNDIQYILQLAKLSSLVYDNEEIQSAKYNHLFSFNVTSTGFNAQILKNDELQQIILVIKGTSLSFEDIINDIELLIGEFGSQTKSADDAYKMLLQYKNQYGYDIVCTGHSLGGSLCQYLLLKYQLKIYTFNPFGILKSFKCDNLSCTINNLGVNWIIAGDAISNAGAPWCVGNNVELSLDKDFCTENNYFNINRLSQLIFCHKIDTMIKLLELMLRKEYN